jgi:hypothetical protein
MVDPFRAQIDQVDRIGSDHRHYGTTVRNTATR